MGLTVSKYSSEFRQMWDDFVLDSRNGNFHLTRGFIEYHGNRFEDYSLMVFNENSEVQILIPTHKNENKISSHLGLTYGGFVFSKYSTLLENIESMQAVLDYLKAEGFQTLYYKAIPHIYHTVPSEDDLYFMFHLNAKLVCRHVNPVITPSFKLTYQQRRMRMIKKSEKAGFTARQGEELSDFWNILEQLLSKYGNKPVHTLKEILYLRDLFPENIKFYGAYNNDEMLAGILVFETNLVSKFQYIGANDKGKSEGAMDYLINYLIKDVYPNKIIDFGTVTGDSGRYLSEGLSAQKEGFGSRTTIHDHYLIDLTESASLILN